MNPLFITLTILLQIALITTADTENCNELKEHFLKSEEDLNEYIDKNIGVLKLKIQQCIDILVKNGKILSLDHYLLELSKLNIKYRENLEMSVNSMKKQLDELNNKHKFNLIDYQIVYPAFKWAQSLDDIFIEIKFAHRHDSPGCLEVKDMQVDIDENRLFFVGYCVLGNDPIKIVLNLKTFDKLNKTQCSHGSTSVGRYQFTLKKQSKKYWKRLLEKDEPLPQNMRVWFEMKEKFQEELKPFEDKEDDIEFDKIYAEAEKDKKKSKGKKRKKNGGEENNVDL